MTTLERLKKIIGFLSYSRTNKTTSVGENTKNLINTDNNNKKMVKELFSGLEGFVSLKLSKIEPCNHNTSKFMFSFPDENQTSGLVVSSAVLIRFKDSDGDFVLRPYTPIDRTNTKGYFTLLVKEYPDGVASKHIHSLKVGDYLEFKGPLVKYKWSPNLHKQVILIAGGTGITPVFQIIREILDNSNIDKTKITLLYANNTINDILLRQELDSYVENHPNQFKIHYIVLEDNSIDSFKSSSPSTDISKGYITQDLIKKYSPSPDEGENVHFFVCGPPPFHDAISGNKISPSNQGNLTGYLKNLGYHKDQVYKF